MAKIKVENLYLLFGSRRKQALKLLKEGKSKSEILKKTKVTVAVNNATFDIQEGEIFVVMGLSGSGKSTLLRCLNRLIEPTAGSILVNGDNVVTMDEKALEGLRRKEMSMVFQHFGLLPHRTVVSNVAFGLEIQNVDEETRKEKAMQAIQTVGLDGYENMMTGELSGGMQQRVGLARALATDPEVLLMDEAFSALDPLIRTNMQDELLELQKKVRKTIVFITHDLDEALKLGDRIAIMKDGRIVQVGTPEDILVEPADDYVKAFVENVDRSNIVTAGSMMFTKFSKVNITKDGPAVALKRMRDLGINSIPVVNNENEYVGYVKDGDVARLKKENVKMLNDALIEDFPAVTIDTAASDIIPLFIDHTMPIPVVDEDRKLKGLVYHAAVVAEVTGREEEEVLKIKEEGGNVNE
jgi:glycine betaine/proline transport system ATP-binding protein